MHYNDNEFDRLFRRLSGSFAELENLWDAGRATGGAAGPLYYGYTMSVGPDGTPVVREFGNAGRGAAPASGARRPSVDEIVDEKEGAVKLVAEMPGVEKGDVKIAVSDDSIVSISAERDQKRYRARLPLRHKVDRDSARATYKNGILELSFRLAGGNPEGKTVEVL